MHSARYQQQSFSNGGLLSACAELSRFLKYEFHIKGTVLCFWSYFRSIECSIV